MPGPDDDLLRRIFRRTRTIALVGASPDPSRPSHYVGQYLLQRGYRVIPVNPGLSGRSMFGETVRAAVAECPPETDMLDLFRRSEHAPRIIAEALDRLPQLQTVWMQIGVTSPQGRALAEARGCDVIENRCPKIEYQRLFGAADLSGIGDGNVAPGPNVGSRRQEQKS